MEIYGQSIQTNLNDGSSIAYMLNNVQKITYSADVETTGPSSEDILDLLNDYDYDGDGNLSWFELWNSGDFDSGIQNELMAAFNNADSDNNGLLSVDEFEYFSLTIFYLDAIIELLNEWDADENGNLSWFEILGSGDVDSGIQNELLAAFNSADSDMNSFLTFDELGHFGLLLQNLWSGPSPWISGTESINIHLSDGTIYTTFISQVHSQIITQNIVNIMEDINRLNLIILPNPVSANFNVQYNLSYQSEIHFYLYSINGDLLIKKHLELQSPGTHSVSFDCSKIESGTYVLKAFFNEDCITKKLIKK